MSSLPTPRSSNSHLTAALLDLADSRYTIYEHTRMAGENHTPHEMLPVDLREDYTSELEESYACNMATYFNTSSVATRSPRCRPVPRTMDVLRQALLLVAHSQRSIYDKTRISGENRIAHQMLPIDCYMDRCSDVTDVSYANAMANYFVSKNVSPL